jgi:glycosyltransferase involved in cell wall biosynthesis
MPKKKIAIFYYYIVDDNAIGRCNRVFLKQLCDKYNFTVFATRFDNPDPSRITWVRIPCIERPVFLFYILFRFIARIYWIWHLISKRMSFDFTVASDGCISGVGLAHVHFCHRFYVSNFLRLREIRTFRALAGSADHLIRSVWESLIYHRSRQIIVPSEGLRQELIQSYRVRPERVSVLSNPVDLDMYAPQAQERSRVRLELGVSAGEFVCVFVALGHFERKGLKPLIEAIGDPRLARLRLFVVGGGDQATAPYRKFAQELNVQDRVAWFGHHADTRPFVWAADAFVLPSRYETFSIVAAEAAACGIPVVTTELNGVRDWAEDGRTGFLLADTRVKTIADTLAILKGTSEEIRRQMGQAARAAVMRFSVGNYARSFENLFDAAGTQQSKPLTNGQPEAGDYV